MLVIDKKIKEILPRLLPWKALGRWQKAEGKKRNNFDNLKVQAPTFMYGEKEILEARRLAATFQYFLIESPAFMHGVPSALCLLSSAFFKQPFLAASI